MTGRLALVTGGKTGIGAAICKELKESGYRVVANYHHNGETAKLFEQETGVKVYNWDVTSPQDCVKGVEKICSDFGSTIEILVNNAGIVKDSIMHKMSIEYWDTSSIEPY